MWISCRDYIDYINITSGTPQVDFLSFTSCLVFLIPSEAGGKMGTSITIVLAYAVYITILSEYLPDTSLQVSQYYIGLHTYYVASTKHIY